MILCLILTTPKHLTPQSTRTGLLCAEFQQFLSRQLVGRSGSTAPASPAGYLVNVRPKVVMTDPFEIMFFIISPLAVILLYRSKNRKVLVAVWLLCALISWLLLFSSEAWHDQKAITLFNSNPNPTHQMIEDFNRDGASKAATLFLGLPLSFAYFGLCLAISRVIGWLGKRGKA